MSAAPEGNIFGKILRGEIPSIPVYEDAEVYAFMDIYPQAPGHVLVIPRNYSPNMGEADPLDVAACMSALQKLIPAIKHASGAGGVTVLANVGSDAGQAVEYTHFHLVPRRPGDTVSLLGPGPAADMEDLKQMAQKIRNEL
jgi:histidine triad (HIT) family protein